MDELNNYLDIPQEDCSKIPDEYHYDSSSAPYRFIKLYKTSDVTDNS